MEGKSMRRLVIGISVAATAWVAQSCQDVRADEGSGFLNNFIQNYQEHLKFTGEGQAPTPFPPRRSAEPSRPWTRRPFLVSIIRLAAVRLLVTPLLITGR